MLQTGDDANQEVANKVNDRQRAMLQNLVDTTDTDSGEFLAYYNSQTYSDFPQSYFQGAVDMLQKKAKKGK